jgi:outer membrane biosynthesis protein TonB
MIENSLWKSRLPYLMMFGILLAIATFGCSQSSEEGGGEQTSKDQTMTTQAGTTMQEAPQETTAAGGNTAARSTQDTQGGAQEQSTKEQPSQQQRQQAEQQAEQQRQQAQQQQQQAQQQGQQQSQQQQQQNQQDQRQTIIVRITGTEGLSFSGRVGSAQELKRVQGSVPEEYELPFRGAAVTAAVRKQEPGRGTLGVEVVRGGEVVDSKDTSSTPGILNIVWTP